jgi:hypothetical protein
MSDIDLNVIRKFIQVVWQRFWVRESRADTPEVGTITPTGRMSEEPSLGARSLSEQARLHGHTLGTFTRHQGANEHTFEETARCITCGLGARALFEVYDDWTSQSGHWVYAGGALEKRCLPRP